MMGHYILVVDDDPDAREILRLVLGTLEIPIKQAHDGREALELIASDRPLLMMLDLSMPHVDGKGVLQKMRSDWATRNVPVLVFTAGSVDDELVENLQLPRSRIMRKGELSMTHLREKAVQILGDVVEIDP